MRFGKYTLAAEGLFWVTPVMNIVKWLSLLLDPSSCCY